MRAAVVDLETYIVVNIIVADAAVDAAPLGCKLIDLEHYACDIGWVYDPVMNDFVDPTPTVEG